MKMFKRFFNRRKPVSMQLPEERPGVAESRELTERLIEEHKTANQAGRVLIEERAQRQTRRYLRALNDAMVIIGERG